MKDLTVIVTGSREWSDSQLIWQALHDLRPSLVVHGACHIGGADRIAECWAKKFGVVRAPFPVDHELDGPWPAAGPLRNIRMLDAYKHDPTVLVLAFPLASSRGTLQCLAEARKRKMPCAVFGPLAGRV